MINQFSKEKICFWCYLVGLMEADGCYIIRKRSKKEVFEFVITGHSGQFNHFMSNLIIFAQCLRLMTRDPNSRSLEGLRIKLNQNNNVVLEKEDFSFGIVNFEKHFFSLLLKLLNNNQPLVNTKKKYDWDALISPIFIINKISRHSNKNKIALTSLNQLKRRVVAYIYLALDKMKKSLELQNYLKEKKDYRAAYYPSKQFLNMWSRNSKKKITKILRHGRVWYKAAKDLK